MSGGQLKVGANCMDADDELIRNACMTAADDLGVRIVSPFRLIEVQDVPVDFIALFPDFGSQRGTAVCLSREWTTKNVVAGKFGFYCSGLHPNSYSQYDREHFIDAF